MQVEIISYHRILADDMVWAHARYRDLHGWVIVRRMPEFYLAASGPAISFHHGQPTRRL